MHKTILGTLITLVSLTNLAEASGVVTEALDCKKKMNFATVKSSLDSLAKPSKDGGVLVYSLKQPLKYGNAELSKITLSDSTIIGELNKNIGYKKAIKLLPTSSALANGKREESEQHMFWKGWTVKSWDVNLKVQDSELDNNTFIECTWWRP